MKKYLAFKNRRLTRELTPIQIQEKRKRRMLMRRMLYGMSQPKGTTTRWPPTGKPILKPMPLPLAPPSPWDFIVSLVTLLPWMRKRKAEAALKDQRSESIKAQGR